MDHIWLIIVEVMHEIFQGSPLRTVPPVFIFLALFLHSKRIPALITSIFWLLFTWWEYMIPEGPYSNRFDLLVIYPFLLFISLYALLSYRLWFSRKKEATHAAPETVQNEDPPSNPEEQTPISHEEQAATDPEKQAAINPEKLQPIEPKNVGLIAKHSTEPVSIGEMLKQEFLIPWELTVSELAEATGIEPVVLDRVCNNKVPMTPKLAYLIAKALGTSPDVWINLQLMNDVAALQKDESFHQQLSEVNPVIKN